MHRESSSLEVELGAGRACHADFAGDAPLGGAIATGSGEVLLTDGRHRE